MRTLSIRTLSDLACERGEEFDPAFAPMAELAEDLAILGAASPIVTAPSSWELRRERERRESLHQPPAWLSAEDLLDLPEDVVHGEPI